MSSLDSVRIRTRRAQILPATDAMRRGILLPSEPHSHSRDDQATESAPSPDLPMSVVEQVVGVERGSGLGFSLDAYNLLDHRHREIGGGGRLGRLVVSRVRVRL